MNTQFLEQLFGNNYNKDNFFLLAGPCVVENEEVVMQTAEAVAKTCQTLKIPYVFKSSYRKANRTSEKSFTGIGDETALALVKKVGGKTLQEIEMTPTDKSKPFHKVYLQVDKAAKTIYSTKVLENGGNRYTYTVSNMKTNSSLADNQFIFDKAKYPGVEVVDLR